MQSDAPNTVADADGGPKAAKRRRVSRACAPCQYAKLRCDGQEPPCTTCRQQGKRCTYEASFKRRGLRSGYVRTLELLWSLTFNEVENAEPVVDELLGRLSKQDLNASSDRTDSTTPASILLDRWKQSNVARHIDDLLNDNDENHADGEEGGIQDESQQRHPDSKPGWIVARNENRQLDQPRLGMVLPDADLLTNSTTAELPHLQGISSRIQPPPYASQLLQLFFRCGQSWLPILQRHVTLKTAFQYSLDSSSLHHGDRSALWAVYAYASAALNHLLIDEHARQHAQVYCDAFYAQAYSMLPLDSDQPVELGHVQCVALLALTRLSSGATTAAWRLMNIATQVLREMTRQQKPTIEHDALARAWLACFILDTLSSACQQAIPSLRYNDVVRYLQVDENDLEEWQPWQRPRTLQSQDTFVETSDVPTHSVGMLVLQAKLLRLLNNSLHLHIASDGLSELELEEWNQDLSNYLARTGLVTVLGNRDLNLLALPPSFMVLSITYTLLASRINGASIRAGEAVPLGAGYPLISHEALHNFRKDDYFHQNFPVLHLLATKICGNAAFDTISNESIHVWQQDTDMNGLVSSSILQQVDLQPGQPVTNLQEHAARFSAFLTENTGANEDSINRQGPDSEMPSIESDLFPTDAPFLEFMDGLDDRSILDNDLFGRSLGFSF